MFPLPVSLISSSSRSLFFPVSVHAPRPLVTRDARLQFPADSDHPFFPFLLQHRFLFFFSIYVRCFPFSYCTFQINLSFYPILYFYFISRSNEFYDSPDVITCNIYIRLIEKSYARRICWNIKNRRRSMIHLFIPEILSFVRRRTTFFGADIKH